MDTRIVDDKLMSPCPFCGEPASLTRTKDGSNYWFPQCKGYKCGCRLFAMPTREQAAALWNERAGVAA